MTKLIFNTKEQYLSFRDAWKAAVNSEKAKKTLKTSEFGYMDDHYIVRLPKECKGPRYNDIKPLKCEIQVRTISMDAWDAVSHHLDYKQKIDIPSKKYHLLIQPNNISLYGIDGMYFYQNILVCVQNGLNRISRFYLDKTGGSVKNLKIIEINNAQ